MDERLITTKRHATSLAAKNLTWEVEDMGSWGRGNWLGTGRTRKSHILIDTPNTIDREYLTFSLIAFIGLSYFLKFYRIIFMLWPKKYIIYCTSFYNMLMHFYFLLQFITTMKITPKYYKLKVLVVLHVTNCLKILLY